MIARGQRSSLLSRVSSGAEKKRFVEFLPERWLPREMAGGVAKGEGRAKNVVQKLKRSSSIANLLPAVS
jgi:hypothetical protein